jgi:hypothetical protein
LGADKLIRLSIRGVMQFQKLYAPKSFVAGEVEDLIISGVLLILALCLKKGIKLVNGVPV